MDDPVGGDATKKPTYVSSDSDESIIKEACDRYAYTETQDQHNRVAQREDTKFVYEKGAQWADDTRTRRTGWQEPCLEFNQLGQFADQVINDMRQGRPGIRVNPASGDASKKTAELKQQLIRGIEYKSKAEAAYDTGFQHAVVGGRGYWRIGTEYESARSFNQCIVIQALPDPLAVRRDPDYVKPDGSDVRYAFVESWVSKDEFPRLYPKAPELSWNPGTDNAGWYRGTNSVLICDYYRLVSTPRDIVLLSDGVVGWKDEFEKLPAGTVPPGVTVVATRESVDTRCEWFTLGGGELVLKRNPWRGRFVPVIGCVGDDIIVDGKRLVQGLIRRAKEPQQMLNYGMTQQAARLSLTPRAPWVAAEGQIDQYKNDWKNANTTNISVLIYTPKSVDGTLVPPPQRQEPSLIDVGFNEWCQQMIGQIRSTMGMYENSLGMKSDEKSGRAILAREKQGDTATFHYVDNLSRAVAFTGVAIDDLIPHYYDRERHVPLVDTEGKHTLGQINKGKVYDQAGNMTAPGDPESDMARGEFAVTVESGPSFATKREEIRATLVELFQAYPPAAQLLGDALMQVVDLPDAEKYARRMKLMLPPNIQQAEAQDEQQGEGAPPGDPQMMQAIQELQQQLQAAGQMLQGLQAENQQLKAGHATDIAEANAKADAEKVKAAADRDVKLETVALQVAGQLLAKQFESRAAPAAAGDGMPQVEPQPMFDLPTLLQMVQMLADQISAAVMAPRQMAVQFGPDGMPIGGVSEVVQ